MSGLISTNMHEITTCTLKYRDIWSGHSQSRERRQRQRYSLNLRHNKQTHILRPTRPELGSHQVRVRPRLPLHHPSPFPPLLPSPRVRDLPTETDLFPDLQVRMLPKIFFLYNLIVFWMIFELLTSNCLLNSAVPVCAKSCVLVCGECFAWCLSFVESDVHNRVWFQRRVGSWSWCAVWALLCGLEQVVGDVACAALGYASVSGLSSFFVEKE